MNALNYQVREEPNAFAISCWLWNWTAKTKTV